MFTCAAEATLVVMQLRPGYLTMESDSAEPIVVLIGVCREHLRPVRLWLEETWPHDAVDVYGLAFFAEHLAEIDGMGVPVWQMQRESVGGVA